MNKNRSGSVRDSDSGEKIIDEPQRVGLSFEWPFWSACSTTLGNGHEDVKPLRNTLRQIYGSLTLAV